MKAYPFLHKHPTTGETTLAQGMDLRDYFAGLAMQSMLVGNQYFDDHVMAQAAYQMADYMMKQRENKHE
jgi:hypothetical protein